MEENRRLNTILVQPLPVGEVPGIAAPAPARLPRPGCICCSLPGRGAAGAGRHPKSVHDHPSVARRARPFQGRRSRLADTDQRGAARVDPEPGPRVIVPLEVGKAGG